MQERAFQKLIVSNFSLLWNQNFISTYTRFQLLYNILSQQYKTTEVDVEVNFDRQSIGQFVLMSGAHLEPVTNFSFSLKFPSDSYVFVIL
jgi:hypothetical protein